MPIENVRQPQTIPIDPELRLRKFDGEFSFAFDWYQDEETVKLLDGLNATKYDFAKLKRMYEYLDQKGELYFIEVWSGAEFRPIGDVTFWQEDLPIVIGDKNYRGRGIARAVVEALIQRARDLGYKEIKVREIYSYNIASQRTFESVGFRKAGCTQNGFSYALEL